MTPIQFAAAFAATALLATLAVDAIGQEIPATETSEAIAAVLQAKCVPCHGPDTQEHGLRLDSLESAQQGGESGLPALVPRVAIASELVRRITLPSEHQDVMPPAGKPALTPEETLAVIRWINRGAPWATVGAAPAPAAEPAAPAAATAGAAVSFASQIKPILDASCVKCHGAERQKADLRLDSAEAIQNGSENGPVVLAGNPEESPLYKLVTLPPDHPDVMPAEGDPLSKEQAELIRQWLVQGAVFDAAPATVAEAAPAQPEGPSFEEMLATLAQGVEPASAEALAAVESWGALALPLDQTTPLLQIDLQRATTGVGEDQLTQLANLAKQITWLNLAGTDVADEDLAQVAKLENLTKLHLERTSVTDAGLAHLTGLKNLQYLNLYGTNVSDAGMAHIAQIPSLRKVFLWETGVTKDAVAQLAESNPALAVDLGWEEPAPAPADTSASKYDEGSCCATAAAEGKDCEHPCCVEARAGGKVCEKCNPNAV